MSVRVEDVKRALCSFRLGWVENEEGDRPVPRSMGLDELMGREDITVLAEHVANELNEASGLTRTRSTP